MLYNIYKIYNYTWYNIIGDIMAGTVTHAYFANDVYNKLNNNTKKIINNNVENMKTYGQGHDIFYFYFSLNLKYGKFIRDKGKFFHRNDTKLFFINMVKYINENNLENNSDVMSFLYGYICHYSLDYITHPYIVHKSGRFKKNDKSTYKFNSKHSDIESYIDCYMIYKNENIKPGKFKIHKFCFNNKYNEDLKKLIDYTFFETYHIKNVSKYFFRSIKLMKILYWLMRYDPYGIKMKIYRLIDRVSGKKAKRFYPISYAFKLNNNEYYLNTQKREWCHPRYNNEISNDSFEDLYNKAIDKSLELINAVNKVIFNKEDIKYLDNYFLNLSFLSGKDCNDKMRNKYFEN